MDKMNTSFTRWCAKEIPGNLRGTITEKAWQGFQMGAKTLLNDAVGLSRDVEFDPKLLTPSRINAQNKPELVNHVQHLAWFLHAKAIPLVKAGFAAQCERERLEKKTEEVTEGILKVKREKLEKKSEEITEELLKLQRQTIAHQEELLGAKEQIIQLQQALQQGTAGAVQTTVKNELQSYSAIVQKQLKSCTTALKQDCAAALAPKKIKAAMVEATVDRGSNLIIHGLPESKEEKLEEKLQPMFSVLEEAPLVRSVERIGAVAEGKNRPVIVRLRNRDMVWTLLSKRGRLRDGVFRTVYLSPDRTTEEREEQRKLVEGLKARRTAEPGKTFSIRKGVVVEVSR